MANIFRLLSHAFSYFMPILHQAPSLQGDLIGSYEMEKDENVEACFQVSRGILSGVQVLISTKLLYLRDMSRNQARRRQ